MLPGLRSLVGLAEGTPPTHAFIAQTSDTANDTSFSFAGQSLGDPHSQRRIVVGITANNGAGGRVVSTCTVAGVSATRIVRTGSTAAKNLAEIWIADVPAGGSGTIDVTTSGTCNSLTINTWAIYSLSGTAVDSAANDGSGVGSLGLLNMEVVSNGIVVFCGICGAASPSVSWNGTDTEVTGNSSVESDGNSYGYALTTENNATRAWTFGSLSSSNAGCASASFGAP